MKRTTYYILLLCLATALACSSEIQPPSSSEESRNQAIDEFLSATNTSTRSLEHHSYIYDNRGKLKLKFGIPGDVSRMEFNEWREYHTLITERILSIPEDAREDHYYDFLHCAYRMVFRGLIKDSLEDPEVQNAMLFYLDILEEFNAPDLYVVRLGIEHLSKHKDIGKYQSHFLKLAKDRMVKYENLLSDTNLDATTSEHYTGQLHDAMMLHSLLK